MTTNFFINGVVINAETEQKALERYALEYGHHYEEYEDELYEDEI